MSIAFTRISLSRQRAKEGGKSVSSFWPTSSSLKVIPTLAVTCWSFNWRISSVQWRLHQKEVCYGRVIAAVLTSVAEERPIIKLVFQSGGEIDSHQYRMENQAEAAKLLNVLTEQLGIGEVRYFSVQCTRLLITVILQKKLRCIGCEMIFDIGSKIDKCTKCGSNYIVAFDKREEEPKHE